MTDKTSSRFRDFLKNNNLNHVSFFDGTTVAIYTAPGKYVCSIYGYQVTYWNRQYEKEVSEMLLKRLFL